MRIFTVWQIVGKRRENSAFGVCMVLHGNVMVQVVCVVFLWFSCHLERDFSVLGS